MRTTSADDSFTFTASDGSLDSNLATISLTINAVNDAPVASDGTNSTDEDTPLDGILIALDVDNTDLSYSLVDAAGHGTVNVNTDGSYCTRRMRTTSVTTASRSRPVTAASIRTSPPSH